MCRKNIHTLKEWRTEMLRLKQEHGAKFETHPDYVKTANCKEDRLTKPECEKLGYTNKTKSRSKTRSRPKPPKDSTYLKKLDEYNQNMKKLKQTKEQLQVLKKERSMLVLKLDSILLRIEIMKRHLEKHMELFSKLDRPSKEALDLKTRKDAILALKQSQKEHEKILREKDKTISDVTEQLEILAIKTEVKPVPSLPRCPNGTRRNEITKLCEKKN
jgi:hypothetical protein